MPRLRFWCLWVVTPGLLVLGLAWIGFLHFGHRVCPNLVIAWSPCPDQVMRASLHRALTQNPANALEIFIGETRRFSIRELMAHSDLRTARQERVRYVLAGRINGSDGKPPDPEAIQAMDRLVESGSPMQLIGILNYQVPNDPLWRRWAVCLASHPDARVREGAYCYFLSRTKRAQMLPWSASDRSAVIRSASEDAISGGKGRFHGMEMVDMSRFEPMPGSRYTAQGFWMFSDDPDRWIPIPPDTETEWEASLRSDAWRVWLMLDGDSAQAELESHWRFMDEDEQDELLKSMARQCQLPRPWLRAALGSEREDETYVRELVYRAIGDEVKIGIFNRNPDAFRCLADYFRATNRMDSFRRAVKRHWDYEPKSIPAFIQAVKGTDLQKDVDTFLMPVLEGFSHSTEEKPTHLYP